MRNKWFCYILIGFAVYGGLCAIDRFVVDYYQGSMTDAVERGEIRMVPGFPLYTTEELLRAGANRVRARGFECEVIEHEAKSKFEVTGIDPELGLVYEFQAVSADGALHRKVYMQHEEVSGDKDIYKLHGGGAGRFNSAEPNHLLRAVERAICGPIAQPGKVLDL